MNPDLTAARIGAIRPDSKDEYMRLRKQMRQMYPYFGFNTQRVDLVLG